MLSVEDEKVMRIDRDAISASFPINLRCIGQFSCINCSLVSLDLMATDIIKIEKFAFAHSFQLRDISFPSCLEKIGKGSFHNCVILEKITFGNNPQLRKISSQAFQMCEMLEIFKFSPHLEFIGENAFKGCRNIKIFDLRNTNLKKVDNIIEYKRETIIYLPASVKASNIISSNLYISTNSEISHPDIKKDECGCFYFNKRIFNAQKKFISYSNSPWS